MQTTSTEKSPPNWRSLVAALGALIFASCGDARADASGATAAQIKTGTPVAVGTANAEGTSQALCRADHVHAQGTGNAYTWTAAQTITLSGVGVPLTGTALSSGASKGAVFSGPGGGASGTGTGSSSASGLIGLGGGPDGQGGNFTGAGTGVGVSARGGSSDGSAGVSATCNATNCNGGSFTGLGTGYGARGQGGATGPGGTFFGGGTSGYGVKADAGNSANAAVNLAPRAAPSSKNDGDVWITTTQAAVQVGGATYIFAGSGTSTSPWSIWTKPVTADARDEEFDSGSAFGSYTADGNQTVGRSVDPYNHSTDGKWSYSYNSLRPGWLVMQQATGAAGATQYRVPISKAVTFGTNEFVYAGLENRIESSGGVTDANVVGLCFSNATSVGAGDDTCIYLDQEQGGGIHTIRWEKHVAGVFTQLGANNVNAGAAIAIHRRGTALDFWYALNGRGWHHAGSTTHANTGNFAYVLINQSASGTSVPGDPFYGVDFIRFKATATDLP